MRDEAIIRAIQRGDEGAIAGVITRYARLMWSVAGSVLRGVGSDQDVEECVADVFVYLWQHPDKFDPRRGSLRSWLAVVARSQAVDRCRALALGIPARRWKTPSTAPSGSCGRSSPAMKKEDHAYQIYEDAQYICYDMTDLFYTDLRQYTESMIAQLGGVFFDEQIWDRVQNINAYYREHLPSLLRRTES